MTCPCGAPVPPSRRLYCSIRCKRRASSRRRYLTRGPVMRTCACGLPMTKKAKQCLACFRRATRRTPPQASGMRTLMSRYRVQLHLCANCGRIFGSKYTRRTCSKPCRERDYNVRSGRRKGPVSHQCIGCGVAFQSLSPHARYCGVSCRKYIKKQIERRGVDLRDLPPELAAVAHLYRQLNKEIAAIWQPQNHGPSSR